LQQLCCGAIVTDAAGRVLAMNSAAERIVATADGLTLQDGVLTPARAFEQAKLTNALDDLMRSPRADFHAFVVGRPSGRLPYAVLITSLSIASDESDAAVRSVALVFLTDFDRRTEISPHLLRELFGFTCAEARLAAAIANGRSLREIAAETGQALPTLRAHLSAMFDKTGVKRQVDLVRLVLGVPNIEPQSPRSTDEKKS